MTTQYEHATTGTITPEMEQVAAREGLAPEQVMEGVAAGEMVIMVRAGKPPLGIGKGLKTKINANIGTSSDEVNPEAELEKAKIAEQYGADTISDLSMGGNIDEIRKSIVGVTSVPLTTVPIYQAVAEKGSFKAVNTQDLYEMVNRQIKDGISSVVLHAGFSYEMLLSLKSHQRIMGMVSKGGALTSAWMVRNEQDNPFMQIFDDFLELLHENDVVLSLGNTMRSGCIYDVKDEPQMDEITTNAKLAERANAAGVQVIVEGMGGHVQPNDIIEYVKHHKEITSGRPLFIAGPLPIDIAVGYDHIAACVGGSIASGAGADYLCYITPAEHLNLPNVAQVREGVIAFKIAAHIGDTIKYGISTQDKKMGELRRCQDWEGQFAMALDGFKAREIHPDAQKQCTMCGRYCALQLLDKFLKE
ncbi:MAG: phosphomethylpyrimidine synthase ThiC [Thermoplasmata archaeon]|nr:phosphomethylpyrimidine synthase ThiC [Thermoplasmata archaeon]